MLFLITCSLNANANRALYVDNFENILGDITAENTLLNYAQSHDIKTLLLYSLQIININHNLTDPNTNNILADFIFKAKTSYGIISIGATGENGNFFTDVIDAYNNSRTEASERFDIYNLEFEYWNDDSSEPGGYYCTTYLEPNGLPCNVNEAFQFYISILQKIDTLANNNSHPITTEAYVGWPTAGQADTIGANLDRLRLHAYVSDPTTAYNFSRDRLINFANGNPNLDVSTIFSSEPNFMKTWLENNSMISAENMFTTDWTDGSSEWQNNINLEGFTYFTYSEITNVPLLVQLNDFEKNQTLIYPSITKDVLYAESTKQIKQMIIYNTNGFKIIEKNNSNASGKFEINVDYLIPGLYFLILQSDSKIETLRFIKQ